MGNAALKSNRVFDDAIGFDAFGFDGTSALKYHPSFYGPDADAVSFERRGAAEHRTRPRFRFDGRVLVDQIGARCPTVGILIGIALHMDPHTHRPHLRRE